MAASFSSSALQIDNFQDAMSYVGPVAKAAGVSVEETAAMLGVLANSGIKGSKAGTSLKRILEEMKGTSGSLTERFKQLGDEGITVGGAMDEVGRRAGVSLIVLADGAKEVETLSTEFGNAEGAAKSMADIMNDTTKGSLKQMTSALEGAGIALGEVLIPYLASASVLVKDIAMRFKELSPLAQGIVISIGALVTVIGPLLVIIPQLVSGVVMLRGAFLALNATMLLNPDVLAGAAILALGLIIYKTGGDVHDTKRKTDEYILSLKQLDKQSQINSINEALRTKATQLNAAKDKLAASEMMLKHGDKFDKAAQLRQINMYNEIIAGVEGAIDALDVAMVEAQSMEVLKVDDLIVPPDPAKANHIANSIDAIRARIADLTKTYNAAAVGSAEYTTAKQQLIAANEELEAALGNTTQSVTLVEGSIDALRARVSELQAAYNAAAPGSEAFTTASKELTIATNELDAALGNTGETLGFFSEFPVGSLGLLQDKLAFLRAELLLLNPETQAFVDKLSEIEARSVIVNGSIETIDESIKNTTSAFKDLGQSITDAFVDAVFEAKSFGDAMLQIGKQLIKTLLGEAIASAIASAASSKNIANQASGGLTIPGFILGAVASVKGAFNQVPALAAGGLAFGETMSVVGDNRNAALDPEVIAPLSKLKDYIGGGQTNVYGRISGDDIVISNSRGARDRNRFV
jgi:hypothetical protein